MPGPTAALRAAFVLASALAATAPAQADYAPFQGYVEMPHALAPMIMGNLATEHLKHLNERRAQGALAAAPAEATMAPPAGAPVGPHALAATFPPERRAQLEQAFTTALQQYHQLEARFAIPRNDVAGAMAAYIAGSYMAYRNVDLPDGDFRTLVGQMRGVLSDSPAFRGSTALQRREIYEQLAIVGMLMATSHEAFKRGQATPDAAANFRRTGKSNLETLLKTDADRVSVSGHGLEIR